MRAGGGQLLRGAQWRHESEERRRAGERSAVERQLHRVRREERVRRRHVGLGVLLLNPMTMRPTLTPPAAAQRTQLLADSG